MPTVCRFTIGLAWSLFRRAGGGRLCSLGHDLNLVRGDSARRRRHRHEPRRLVRLGLRRPWVQKSRGRPALIHALCARQVQSFSKYRARIDRCDCTVVRARTAAGLATASYGCSCPISAIPKHRPASQAGGIQSFPICQAVMPLGYRAFITCLKPLHRIGSRFKIAACPDSDCG